ncbi:D-alanine--D-alanine ligase [Pedobacter sp. LMG 31464]|uniref:D-alanine--D-alanine ligase n=1 Tax=Pedobacter planticolens TaxID=2679964 RepID=A0A923IXY8_9SPHI|nr:D-alanine--D-alanine ligase [Pedobacter planticolens]MBB2146847.1 D-alanine--D-alanine ligase [Pedobacter planticolens]
MKLFMLLRKCYIKLTNWEYWPMEVIYLPIFGYWIFLGIKARSLFFFSAANPKIENAGFAMERKSLIYQTMPKRSYPSTVLAEVGAGEDRLLELMKNAGLQFPIIAKPDVGQRGIQVKLITNKKELGTYADQLYTDFLLQEYISFPNEVGIFYYRIPGEKTGKISGIVGKEFMEVIGDGTSTIRELVIKNNRYLFQLNELEKVMGKEIEHVLNVGETQVLVPYGNHCRGALFLDLSHLITAELTASIDTLCMQIPEFYFGRLDIKYNTWKELCEGKNFVVIELNGASSEPTHIYDPKHSIWFAWKELIRHWNILYQISMINQKNNNLKLMGYAEGMALIRKNSEYVKLIA